MKPKVSVLTTVYNGMPYLRETVESILSQTLQNFEYVIVDDGSDDGTRDYLAGLTDGRLRIIHLPRNGRGGALNVGLAACASDFVAVLDADDVSSPVRLELQYRWITENPGYDVITSTCCLKPMDLQIQKECAISLTPISPKEFIRRTPIAHSAVIMRRSSVMRVGGYDVRRKNLFDYDLWLRLAEKGHRFGRVDIPLVYKRIHKNQKFESKNRLGYLWAGLKGRMRAMRLFSRNPWNIIYPFSGFLFGLIPIKVRRRLFRLSCE